MPVRRSLLCLATGLAVASALLVAACDREPASRLVGTPTPAVAAATATATAGVATGVSTPASPISAGTQRPRASPTALALRVGIKPLDPFVIRTESRYSGFSIELWDEVARRNGWSTSYVWYDTLPPLLDDLTASKIDVGIAGISITREREARLDFTYPMFKAGLQVLVPQRTDRSWFAQMASLASTSLWQYLLGLLVVMFLAGNVVWLFQRQHR